MSKVLKPSMFNHRIYTDKGMMLFNSLSGAHNILYVSPDHEQIVLDLLAEHTIVFDDTNDILVKLFDFGYLVDVDVDEKAIRQKIHNEITMDSTLNLVIHTTTACNFRCKYCYMDFGVGTMPREVQEQIVQFIRHNLCNATSLQIAWFGGEPLLGLDAITYISEKAIELCRTAKKMYTASITTNGSLLTPDVLNTLRKCRVNSYTITLDGLQDIHDQYRVLANGAPTFQTIVNNLVYIRDHLKYQTIRVTIRNNITRKFATRIHEYIDYYTSLFGDDKRFKFLIRIVDDWGGESVATIKEDIVTYSYLGEVFCEIAKLDTKLDFSPCFSSLDKGGVSCDAMSRNKYTISASGLISKCDEAACSSNSLGIGNIMDANYMVDDVVHAKWLYSHLQHTENCDNCFFSIPCLMNGCPKHTISTGKHACPLNLEEISGMIQLAGSQYHAGVL